MRIWTVAAAAMLAVCAGRAQAGPIAMSEIPANVKWIAHIDADAMRESVVVRSAYDAAMEKFGWAEMILQNARDDWGTDPRDDLHSLTFYGTGYTPQQGVLIVKLEINSEKLLAKAQAAPEHATLKHGEYVLHTWKEGRAGGQGHTATGVLYKSNVFVFGARTDDVKKALDVLDGKAASLSGKPCALNAATREGATVIARAIDLRQAKLPIKSPVLKGVEQLSLEVGERAGESFFQSQVTVANAETAQQIKAVVDGTRALVLLAHCDDPLAKTVIEGLSAEQSSKTVTVKFHMGAEKVWEVVKKAVEEAAKRHKLLNKIH